MADRVTQQVLQTAYQPTPTARVTSVVVEVAQNPPAPTARVTSVVVEVAQNPPAPSVRVTSVAMEVLQSVTSSPSQSLGIMYVIAG